MPETHFPASQAEWVRTCLDLSPEGAAFWLASLEEVCAAAVAPAAAAVDEEGEPPFAALKALAEIGAFGVQIPREQGGLGFGNALAALVVERTARSCASTAAILMFHYQVVHRTLGHAPAEVRERQLPPMATGELLAASAWTEPGARTKTDVRTRLTERAGRLTVTGTKTYCTGLGTAGVIDVLADARTEQGQGPTFVRVPADAPGVGRDEVYRMLGLRGTSTGTVVLREAEVEESAVLGGIGSAPALMRANHETPLNPGLLALGIASAALGTVTRAALPPQAEREPEAKPLSQARTLQLARSTLALDAAYAYAGHLLSRAARFPEQAHLAASQLKASATGTAEQVTRELLHVAGSRGFLADFALERHLRDAQATALMGPGNELCLQRVADALA
ncbi:MULTISPECIES: acyl-CoA dehydrogenase family protein [Streptomyces]|uniref:Acyl-CoA dehydrogenase domain-containing protein n=1 Tax=Streptomyces albus (strain ATCC 21838 / DSM 41398 / FERM P-419 / JCM 4703 / NBRC 107858) TaxID=1081613 RepID=A0A0B5F6R0_STRA4|nr:acyl-CoA dehydrogenase family protein [Streptomyces sp. SCSIO ZS0520]AJE86027.1 acyl-CoA dehydrogenase domain-containing protein [Streptomyces albus]AOU80329.1 acyl-CoA dehydrogenase domain-containing protein [Streptomyces albus]AYN36040.1 acyl-CoA dehydrogenase [Streptomyces albus]